MKERWIIVANRLPVQKDAKTGKLMPASGGLVSALTNIKTPHEMLWVGAVTELTPGLGANLKPVMLQPDLYDAYYNGLSNDVLWPGFHYETEMVKFTWDAWRAYEKVNRLFAAAIAKIARKNDLIWVHDYHLFLLPKYLKEIAPHLKVGFFLHIPFPGSEVFRQLPIREEVLQGMLSADLIGFQDYAYLSRFCRSIHSILGVDSNLMNVDYKGRQVKLGVFPVGIDSHKFIKAGKSSKVEALMSNLRAIPRYETLVLGVDRLDYIKGIELKLKAFREALLRKPELIGKVSLLQIAVPSREKVPEYQKLRDDIEALVGKINGELGTPFYVPVQYLYTSVSFSELVSLYRYSKVLLITSRRDGMNLVSQEYIAAQDPEDPGVVLLSEFTGAISNLSHVIGINPWNTSDTAEKLIQAVNMPAAERVALHRPMLDYLKRYTASTWAASFLEELSALKKGRKGREDTNDLKPEILPTKIRKALSKPQKILFLDYDGTLVPIMSHPEDAILPKKMYSILKQIARYKDFQIVLITGRDRNFIMKQIPGIPLAVACEHGAVFYSSPQAKPVKLARSNKKTWYPIVKKIMNDYASRVPQSFVEEKSYGISWHYRNSPESFALYQSRKLSEELETGLTNEPVSILHGKKVIEARAIEANKGAFALWYLERYFPDGSAGIIAMGDDATDEDLFERLRDRGVTVKVGPGSTAAEFRLPAQDAVLRFLNTLADY